MDPFVEAALEESHRRVGRPFSPWEKELIRARVSEEAKELGHDLSDREKLSAIRAAIEEILDGEAP